MLHRNCLLKHVIERKIEERGIRGRRGKQLPDDFRETRSSWKLKEEALARIVLSGVARFGRGSVPVVVHTA